MSTSGPSTPKVSPTEFAQMKEQMSELMRMVQQLVVGGWQNSSGHGQGVPQTENENQSPPEQDQGHHKPPQGNDQEMDPFKDKTLESRYGQVKNQMETLAEKLWILEGSSAHESVNLDNLSNFPQVIMPPKFKAPEFIKYDGIGDHCTDLRMFCRKMAPYGDNHPLLCQIFPDSLTGLMARWYARLEKSFSWGEMANSFLEYYRFNTEIAPDCKVLMRTEKKSGESFQEYAQRWHELAAQMQHPMMENEMIRWFIDNLKSPYYEKIISTQVTHFASLIPIGERINEGIRSKKIMDPKSLSSMVEQQVKKMTSRKAKEAYLHIVDNASERPRGITSAYATPTARPYRQQVQSTQAPNPTFN